MPTDALKLALQNQKTADAEADLTEVIEKALEVPKPMLYRILYAAYCLSELETDWRMSHPDKWDELLPNAELRDAIKKAMVDGARRVVLRRSILEGKPISVDVKHLVPVDQKDQICNGCPERMNCVAENISTPAECFKWRKASLQVYPVRLTDTHVEVEAQQPAGRHYVPLKHITFKEKP
jgi:hypothetical protein